ncbi:MAG: hypothetical protein A2Z04_02550 [Chloroflexi bacterium RBG_16_57_9]|nr:MAG: hypothetical protein A2Z04_02550 [Chloroflexi bacterium RBG_16_57_9]
MRFSSRGEYGLRALVDLAEHYGEGPVASAHIAERQLIPANYLNQLLLALRNGGLISSLRGPRGGHMLARSPEEIRLSDAISILEGPMAPMDCVNPEIKCECELVRGCGIYRVWAEVKAAADQILASRTLADLVPQRFEKRLQQTI